METKGRATRRHLLRRAEPGDDCFADVVAIDSEIIEVLAEREQREKKGRSKNAAFVDRRATRHRYERSKVAALVRA
jgi:hypothetical protein